MSLLERQYKHAVALWPPFAAVVFCPVEKAMVKHPADQMRKVVQDSVGLFKTSDDLRSAYEGQRALLLTCLEIAKRTEKGEDCEDDLAFADAQKEQSLLLLLVHSSRVFRKEAQEFAKMGDFEGALVRMTQYSLVMDSMVLCAEILRSVTHEVKRQVR